MRLRGRVRGGVGVAGIVGLLGGGAPRPARRADPAADQAAGPRQHRRLPATRTSPRWRSTRTGTSWWSGATSSSTATPPPSSGAASSARTGLPLSGEFLVNIYDRRRPAQPGDRDRRRRPFRGRLGGPGHRSARHPGDLRRLLRGRRHPLVARLPGQQRTTPACSAGPPSPCSRAAPFSSPGRMTLRSPGARGHRREHRRTVLPRELPLRAAVQSFSDQRRRSGRSGRARGGGVSRYQ